MGKVKRDYIVIKTQSSAQKLQRQLEIKHDFLSTTKQLNEDCLVYSLTYTRYSFNNLQYLQGAPINMHVCKDMDEFNSLVSAHALGVDLSSLWKQL